jgi:hypothetical protein
LSILNHMVQYVTHVQAPRKGKASARCLGRLTGDRMHKSRETLGELLG